MGLTGALGLVATGIVVTVILLGIAAILDCALNADCRARFEQDVTTIGNYGSAAPAGAWALSGQATRFAWQHFPDLPPGSVCALGAVEGIATNSITNAIGGQRSSASDTTFAAAMGCASGGGGGSDSPGESADAIRRITVIEQDGSTFLFRLDGPQGVLEVLTDVRSEGDTLILDGLHIYGEYGSEIGPNDVGISELREFARLLGKQEGATEVKIYGFQRASQSGANPGHTPKPVTIKVR